jgi:hypothetical protein
MPDVRMPRRRRAERPRSTTAMERWWQCPAKRSRPPTTPTPAPPYPPIGLNAGPYGQGRRTAGTPTPTAPPAPPARSRAVPQPGERGMIVLDRRILGPIGHRRIPSRRQPAQLGRILPRTPQPARQADLPVWMHPQLTPECTTVHGIVEHHRLPPMRTNALINVAVGVSCEHDRALNERCTSGTVRCIMWLNCHGRRRR